MTIIQTIHVGTETVTFERVADLLCSAMEGGVYYWARIDHYDEPEDAYEYCGEMYKHISYPLSRGGAMYIDPLNEYDDEPTLPTCKVDLESIAKGLSVMREKYPRHWSDFTKENEDACTGDVFLQCVCFGEVVFG